MTEREIPDPLGFLFGGMTDESISASAPPVMSEPENALAAPVYSSRREARAAGGLSVDAATPAPVPEYDGIASLFPLLGDAPLSPLTTHLEARSAFDSILAPSPSSSAQAEPGATQAIPTADVATELATPVAPYVVPQSGSIPIQPVSIQPIQPISTVSPAELSTPTPSWHVADAFPMADADSVAAADPIARRSVHAAAPAEPSARPKQSARGRSNDRKASRRGPTPRSNRSNRPTDDAKPMRQRAFGVGVMVLVSGLFAVLAIPAYADNDAGTLTAAAAVQTQKVAVANAAASTIKNTARDGYTATSAADLRSIYAQAMREQNIEAYLQSGAKAKGDDYPWFAELSRNQGGGLSPLGYYYRECVDFVAWRLNRDAGTTSAPFRWTWSKLTPNGGDAQQWKAAWLAHGWPTGTTPVPGAVAWFGHNHVGYVNGILDDGQVLVEEYNYTPHAYDTRVINASDAYYLYAPPN